MSGGPAQTSGGSGVNRAIVGVGSNIHAEYHVKQARRMVEERHRLIASSAFILTRPVGFHEQPDFLNGAWLIETEMDRPSLKAWLLETETKLGRVRGKNRNGPRTIDLDIVVWNGRIVDETVYERDFLQRSIEAVWPGIL